ncbi:MAG TPA: pilus assembly protein PilN [Desulfobacterales bacterium]|nr:pilus assembly protein PilN [Desulfobacterales bacterium]
MMIRINLLPIRELKRRAAIRRNFLAVVGGFLCVLLALGGVAWWQTSRIEAATKEIGRLQREKQRYARVNNRIRRLKQTRELLEKKTAVIRELKRRTSLPVHMLDQIAELIPADRMWLNRLGQNGGTLALQGVALDNATIAQFMEALAASPYFQAPELINASQQAIAGQNLKAFNMTVRFSLPKKEQAP